MKKSFKIVIVLAAMMVFLGTATTAFASEGGPGGPGTPVRDGDGDGKGRMGPLAELLGITEEELQAKLASGMMIEEISAELGIELHTKKEGHEADLTKTAERLGLTVEELQAKIDSGMTIQEIAAYLGVELPPMTGQPAPLFPGETRPGNGGPDGSRLAERKAKAGSDSDE